MEIEALTADLASAVAETKTAAKTVTETKANVDAMSARVAAIEEKSTMDAETLNRLGEIIDGHDKRLSRIGGPGVRTSSLTSPEAKAFCNFVATGAKMEMKDIQEAVGADGGVAVPLDISGVIQNQLLEVNPLRRLAYNVTASSPNFRHLINIRGATSQWGGEIDTRLDTDTPQFAQVEPELAEHYALATITAWAARDILNGGAEAFLRDNIVAEFARAEAEKFVNGSGLKEPFGILSAPVSTADDATRPLGTWKTVPSGDAATITPDGLLNTVYDLQASYRRGATWLMNSMTAGVIRKLKDVDGRFLWADGLALGQPPALLGYPVEIVEEFPDIAAAATPIGFGNVSAGYMVVDLTQMWTIRDEVTRPGWIRVYLGRRLGATVTDTKALRLIAIAA